MRTRRWAMALMVGVLVSLTACGQGAEETSKLEPRLQRMLPKDRPAVAVTARGGQPAETRQVTGKTFSMYVPTNFQEASAPTASGEKIVGFDAPSSTPAAPVRVAVLADLKPKTSALEQSYTLEVLKQTEGVKDLTRSTVKWPGAKNAILLQWTQKPAGASATDQPQQNWQLMAQVNDELIVNLVALAPAGEFKTAGLAKIFETFRPHA